MEKSFLETLLHEDEGNALDFKRDEYPFVGADDNAKSELLKDIVAFANSWRHSVAYILIGVEDIRVGRSVPVGVQGHPDDASLQQFVNSKTNRPVAFSYEALAIDSVQVGVIRIELQDRPTFLKKDFGKLKSGTVYIRRGSSTDTADPTEVHRMGVASARQEKLLDKPFLEPELTSLRYVNVMRHRNDWLFVELALEFVIRNAGRVASDKWKLVVEELDGQVASRLDDYKIGRESFPDGTSSRNNVRMDGPILPSLSYKTDVAFGVYLRPRAWDAEQLSAEFERMLPTTLSLGFRAVSESSSGQKTISSVEPVFNRQDTLRRILERC